MTWVKLDDGLPDHRKVSSLSDGAFPRFVEALCFCSRNLTDGTMTAKELARIGTSKKEARELVERGLWHDAQDGIVVHDYLKYQPARAQVQARREGSRVRMAKHRVPECYTATEPQQTECYAATSLEHSASRARVPVPSRPVPDPEPEREDLSELRSSSSGKPDPSTVSARVVFDCWRQEHGHPAAKFSKGRQSRIKARFKDGFTDEQLCTAIRNAKNDAWLMGKNERQTVFDDLESLLKDAAKVERLLALAEPKPNGAKSVRVSQIDAAFARVERLRGEEKASGVS